MDRRSQIRHPRWLPRKFRPTPEVLRSARRYAERRFGERLDEALEIEGFLRLDEAAMLCWLARESPPGAILEIGSFQGKSTVFLAKGMSPDHTLTAVDPHVDTEGLDGTDETDPDAAAVPSEDARWEGYRGTLDRWGVADRVESVRRFSYNLRPDWSRPLSMLWIDGHHGHDAVRRDIDDWVNLVVPGGALAFHDTNPNHTEAHGWGVREAILEKGVFDRGFRTVLELRNAWFLRRPS